MATTKQHNAGNGTSKRAASQRGSGNRRSPVDVASRAAEQLRELTGRQVEGVTGLERTEDGWTVRLEVVESRRIPDTADVLSLYEIQVDDRAELTGCRRLRRYARGQTGDE